MRRGGQDAAGSAAGSGEGSGVGVRRASNAALADSDTHSEKSAP